MTGIKGMKKEKRQKEKLTQVNCRVDLEMKKKLEELMISEHRTMSQTVEYILIKYFK